MSGSQNESFWNNQNPQKPKYHIKNNKKPKNSLICLPYFGPYQTPFWAALKVVKVSYDTWKLTQKTSRSLGRLSDHCLYNTDKPKTGSNSPKYGKNVRRCFVFLRFLMVFFGSLIIPERLILTSGHIAILFETFLELPKM